MSACVPQRTLADRREEFFLGDRRSKRSARRNASLTSGEIGYELLVRKNGQR